MEINYKHEKKFSDQQLENNILLFQHCFYCIRSLSLVFAGTVL